MKKALMFLSFILLVGVFFSFVVNAEIVCTDSDGGQNIFVKGSASGAQIKETFPPSYSVSGEGDNIQINPKNGGEIETVDVSILDYCEDNSNQVEYFCMKTKQGTFVTKGYSTCLKGCNDGVCLPQEIITKPVTCIFADSNLENECQTSTAFGVFKCSGIGECTMNIKGYFDNNTYLNNNIPSFSLDLFSMCGQVSGGHPAGTQWTSLALDNEKGDSVIFFCGDYQNKEGLSTSVTSRDLSFEWKCNTETTGTENLTSCKGIYNGSKFVGTYDDSQNILGQRNLTLFQKMLEFIKNLFVPKE